MLGDRSSRNTVDDSFVLSILMSLLKLSLVLPWVMYLRISDKPSRCLNKPYFCIVKQASMMVAGVLLCLLLIQLYPKVVDLPVYHYRFIDIKMGALLKWLIANLSCGALVALSIPLWINKLKNKNLLNEKLF